MAVDAAYLEPTIEVVTPAAQNNGEPQFGFDTWGSDVLTPHRAGSVHAELTVAKSSRLDQVRGDSLPSLTSLKRSAYENVPMAGMSTTSDRYEELARQHGELAVKKLEEGGLTAAEERQLRMVKWALDSIEMEQMEPAIKRLQNLVQMHRQLQKEVDRLVSVVR